MCEYDRRVCLSIDSQFGGLLRQQLHKVFYVVLGASSEVSAIERTEVEIVHSRLTWPEVLEAFSFQLLQFRHLFGNLLLHELESTLEHVLRLTLLTKHSVQSHEGLAHARSDIQASTHAFPPAP